MASGTARAAGVRSSGNYAETVSSCRNVDGVGADPRAEEGRAEMRRTIAKSSAVLVATAGLLGILCGIGVLLSESTQHVRGHWDVYQREAGALTREARVLFQKVPGNVL